MRSANIARHISRICSRVEFGGGFAVRSYGSDFAHAGRPSTSRVSVGDAFEMIESMDMPVMMNVPSGNVRMEPLKSFGVCRLIDTTSNSTP